MSFNVFFPYWLLLEGHQSHNPMYPRRVFPSGRPPSLAADPGAKRSMAAAHSGLRYVDLFCTSAPVLADASATPDGTHFDDDTNWLKAQVLLDEMCQ